MRAATQIRAPSRRLCLAAALALACSVPAPGVVLAQDAAPERDLPTRREELQSKQQELDRAREQAERLKADIAEIAKERSRLAADLVATAGRLKDSERALNASEARLADLSTREEGLRKSLAGRRAVIAELLVALERMGQHPPPALLVRPEDALASLRSAMLLGSILPDMRADAEALVQDLTQLGQLRREITAEHDNLSREHADLEADRARLAVLVDARQKQEAEQETALADEQKKAQSLAKDVSSLNDLIARVESEVASARKASEEARNAPAPASAGTELAALGDPGRLTPAIAFGKAKGLLPLPVVGKRMRGFGDDDGYGGTLKGVDLRTRPNAPVTAPCDGWVVYAGPFRSYGQLLILNAGGGYHVLLAGMQTINVGLGQFVLTGEPVAAMGDTKTQSAAAATDGSRQPVLYVEFRKDGTSIDPGPWWAGSSAEKVRG